DILIEQVLNKENFCEKTKRQAEWVIADTVLTTIYGVNTEEELKRYIKSKEEERFSNEQIPIIGANTSLDIKDSLIIHGTAVVSNELDEGNTFAKGHPSAHVFPTLFTTAWQNNADVETVIEAYIKAYEISSRIAGAAKMHDKMHPHGTWGNVGGAIAKAIIEQKTNKEIKQIILLTLSLPLATSWLAAQEGQIVRNLYTGLGSFLAYEAVNLSNYGFTSNHSVVRSIWGDILGNDFEEEKLTYLLLNPPMIQKNYMKIHPACRFTHASIDAARILREQITFPLDEISEITVDTYNLAARCDVQIPKNKLQAKFSIPYTVACTLLGKNLFANYKDNLCSAGELAKKIKVINVQEYTDMLPEKRAANVTIKNKDGR